MGFRYMEKKYYGWRGGKNNRFLHDFYIYDLRHNSSDKKWQSLGSLFSFNFLAYVTGTFWGVTGIFSYSPKMSRAFFFVTGKNMRFLSRANQKLSRAFFAVKIIVFVSRAYFGHFWKKCHGQLKTCHVEKKTTEQEGENFKNKPKWREPLKPMGPTR